jgi:hypothetical protein
MDSKGKVLESLLFKKGAINYASKKYYASKRRYFRESNMRQYAREKLPERGIQIPGTFVFV